MMTHQFPLPQRFPSIIFESYDVLRFNGPKQEALDFLHRITTQDFKSQSPEDAPTHGALLTPTGQIKHLFQCLVSDGAVYLFAPSQMSADSGPSGGLLESLEALHFTEDFSIEAIVTAQALPPENQSGDQSPNESLFWPIEINSKTNLLEAPLLPYLAMDKGCYPGQEAIEKTFTYGSPAKKLMKLIAHKAIPLGAEVTLKEKVIGKVLAQRKENLHIAQIQRPHFGQIKQTDQGELVPFANDFVFKK
jgi:folate-binding Fe-S cluster repair protein YgfZ